MLSYYHLTPDPGQQAVALGFEQTEEYLFWSTTVYELLTTHHLPIDDALFYAGKEPRRFVDSKMEVEYQAHLHLAEAISQQVIEGLVAMADAQFGELDYQNTLAGFLSGTGRR